MHKGEVEACGVVPKSRRRAGVDVCGCPTGLGATFIAGAATGVRPATVGAS